MEQIVGLRARIKTNKMKNKEFFIFDGRAWEPLDKVNLEIDISHELTQEEMRFLSRSKDEPYGVIVEQLAALIEQAKKEGMASLGSSQEISMLIAVDLEGYLNRYNYDLLFKRNLKAAINSHLIKKKASSFQDKAFQKQLSAVLAKSGPIFEEVRKLYEEYVTKAPLTEFKAQFFSEYSTFEMHYRKREYYEKLQQKRQKVRKEALELSSKASEQYKKRNYHKAAALFFESLQKMTGVCLKSDLALAVAYGNVGKSMLKGGQYKQAEFLLENSLILLEDYIEQTPKSQLTRKTVERTLLECRQGLSLAFGPPIQNLSKRAAAVAVEEAVDQSQNLPLLAGAPAVGGAVLVQFSVSSSSASPSNSLSSSSHGNRTRNRAI
jgi:hypothetical protein